MRDEPRVEILEDSVKVELESKADFFSAYARNISRGGVFVPTDHLLPVGARVSFAIHFDPDEPPFEGIGEVAWARAEAEGGRRPGMGIKFVRLSSSSKQLAQNVLALLERYGDQISEAVQAGKKRKTKVLVVDDSEFILNWTRHILQAAGCEVLVADNVWVGPIVKQQRPDLVLMDVGMGKDDGAKATRDLRSLQGKDARTRYVLYSVKTEAELAELAERYGADGYLRKSDNPEDLIKGLKDFV